MEYGDAAPGISGIETAIGIVLAMVDAGQVSLARAIHLLTVGPARAVHRRRARSDRRVGLAMEAGLVAGRAFAGDRAVVGAGQPPQPGAGRGPASFRAWSRAPPPASRPRPFRWLGGDRGRPPLEGEEHAAPRPPPARPRAATIVDGRFAFVEVPRPPRIRGPAPAARARDAPTGGAIPRPPQRRVREAHDRDQGPRMARAADDPSPVVVVRRAHREAADRALRRAVSCVSRTLSAGPDGPDVTVCVTRNGVRCGTCDRGRRRTATTSGGRLARRPRSYPALRAAAGHRRATRPWRPVRRATIRTQPTHRSRRDRANARPRHLLLRPAGP